MQNSQDSNSLLVKRLHQAPIRQKSSHDDSSANDIIKVKREDLDQDDLEGTIVSPYHHPYMTENPESQ